MRGESAVYIVVVREADGLAFCSCPSTTTCSHIMAAWRADAEDQQ